jgi:class 3 adenylate cyclase/tetratricopeptide (TPR) repeat protein
MVVDNTRMPPTTLRCTACQFENPPGMRFCGQCGAPLAPKCPSCGADAPAGFKFCGQCGTPLGAAPAPTAPAPAATYTPRHLADKILKSRSAIEGERRQVTVLFADIAGFTSLAERLDPEEVHGIVDACFERITAEVHRFEGTINQYTGDGVMALFGAPIAHEDSARRAVHAALGIQRAIRAYADGLAKERGLSLAMRIGLNTGAVVVGRIGDDLRMDYTAVGDTTNLAARMQQNAAPGTVLITDATRRAVEGFFEASDRGVIEVKGRDAVRAFEVVRSRNARSRIDIAHERGLTPFVGRERERAVLLERVADVVAGRGQAVFIGGDAGIGKSRLLYEFRRALDAAGHRVTWLEGQCVSFGQSIPFLPLIDQLRKNFRIDEFDGEPEIIAKVEHGFRAMGDLDAHAPFIRYLLSVDPGDPAVTTMDAPTRRRLVFAALRALANRGAIIRPLVLVVEDLHWMDSSSEEYLASLLDSMAAMPVMLILTYRLGYTPPFRAHSFQTAMSLTTLPERDAMSVARSALGVETLPDDVASTLMAKAEGVPLFIEEVAKTLLDLGVLRREGGTLTFVKGAGAVVPETMQDIIMARLDRLGEDGKRTVQVASVIGREFLVRLLSRVTGMTDRLEQLLRELQGLELIYEKAGFQELTYIFKHAFILDVAYGSLLRDRRRTLHRAVGYALEELYPDRMTDHYEELAHHFSHGEEWAKAFEYLAHSGDRAKSTGANQVAIDWYTRAIDVAGRVADGVPRKRLAEVYQQRGQILTVSARLDEGIADAGRMLELARGEGDRRMEAEALADMAYSHHIALSWDHTPELKRCAEAAFAIAEEIGDDRLRARTLFLLASLDQMEQRLDEAAAKFGESLRMARAGGYRAIVVNSQTLGGVQRVWQANFDGAIAMSREAEQTAREIHDGFNEVFAMSNRSFAHLGQGDYGVAYEVILKARALARERDNHFIVGRTTNTLGFLYQEFGDFSRARELDRESADLGHRIKNGNVEVSALINAGFDDLHTGAPDRALTLFEETLVRAEKAFGAHRWRWAIHLRFGLASALMALNRDGDALTQAERGLTQAIATDSRKYVGWFHAVRGEIAFRAGDHARAVTELAQAVDVARGIGYPTLTWQAAHLLGQAHERSGHREDALASLTLARAAIDRVMAAAPELELRGTLMAWRRVQAVNETFERVRKG